MSAISTRIKEMLNRIYLGARIASLGTIIQNIQNLSGIVLARGKVPVGNSSGVASALDAKGDGKILVGDGTDLNSVAVSGDVTLANDGAVTIAANAVEPSMLKDFSGQGYILRGGASGAPEEYDASGDGKILIGDGSDVSSVAVSGDVTITNAGVVSIGAAKVENPMIDRDEYDIDLTAVPVTFAGVKTDGDVEEWLVHDSIGSCLQCKNIGDKTSNATWVRGTGVEPNIDNTDNEGCEITVNGSSSGADASFIAGTDDFFVESKITIADVSELDEVYVGFRKAEAFQAVVDNYDEMLAVNVNAGDVYVESILNNGSTVEVDTTDNIADGEYVIVRIEHQSSVGLSSAISLANDLKAKYNAHCADTADHTTAADDVNTIGADDATDLASLITLVTEMLTDYAAHDDDAELGANWVYHAAQEGGDHSLASAVAPTDLPECIARLNDFKSKYNAHDADGTCHGVGSNHASAVVDASSSTIQTGVNAALAAPSVTDQFTFDDGEEVVPFIRVLKSSSAAAATTIASFKCGRL